MCSQKFKLTVLFAAFGTLLLSGVASMKQPLDCEQCVALHQVEQNRAVKKQANESFWVWAFSNKGSINVKMLDLIELVRRN